MIDVLLGVLYVVVAAVCIAAGLRLRWAARTFRMTTTMTPATVIDEKPSVSVVIPARNEGHAMTDSLQSVVNSNYPKLEIIVMDDSSADKTSALIKAFAHDGVRFVEGKALPKGWLGKNHALDTLVRQASGTYVLFMDVDTRLAPDAIEQLVAYAEQEKAGMVSVLPRREDGLRLSTIFSPLRYFWEILFHSSQKPAVASSAWLVRRDAFMERFNGFETMKDVTQPESLVAAAFMSIKRYRFLIGTKQIGVSYVKKWSSQVETAQRLVFPLLGARVAHSIIAVLDLLIVVSPLIIFATGGLIGWNIHHAIAGLLWLGFATVYAFYTRMVWSRGWWAGALLWDVIVIQEIVLIIRSTIRYVRGSITWKGRPIRIPESLNK